MVDAVISLCMQVRQEYKAKLSTEDGAAESEKVTVCYAAALKTSDSSFYFTHRWNPRQAWVQFLARLVPALPMSALSMPALDWCIQWLSSRVAQVKQGISSGAGALKVRGAVVTCT